jgi:molybdopterin converting factor small subunit
MTLVRIPTPLRPYAAGQKEARAEGATVLAVLEDLVSRHPELRPHLFNGDGGLRPYVNLFLNEQDIHLLQGVSTVVGPGDRLMIVPSIAGGRSDLQPVDHAALRTNQAVLIGLLAAAFVADAPWLTPLIGALMLLGSAQRRPAFAALYRLLRRLGRPAPDVIPDNPEPHRFAQLLGGAVLLAGSAAFAAGQAGPGWGLAGVVAALAALNLFAGFCVGCALYYWLARWHVPGFHKAPPPGSLPGRRPAG